MHVLADMFKCITSYKILLLTVCLRVCRNYHNLAIYQTFSSHVLICTDVDLKPIWGNKANFLKLVFFIILKFRFHFKPAKVSSSKVILFFYLTCMAKFCFHTFKCVNYCNILFTIHRKFVHFFCKKKRVNFCNIQFST